MKLVPSLGHLLYWVQAYSMGLHFQHLKVICSAALIKFKIFQPLDRGSIALRVLYVQAYSMGLYSCIVNI